MHEEVGSINAKTSIPLFSVLVGTGVLIPLVVKALMWAAHVDDKATAALKNTQEQRQILWQLKTSQIRIETKLGTLPKNEPSFPRDEASDDN